MTNMEQKAAVFAVLCFIFRGIILFVMCNRINLHYRELFKARFGEERRLFVSRRIELSVSL